MMWALREGVAEATIGVPRIRASLGGPIANRPQVDNLPHRQIHMSSRRKLRSMARAEWVMAPEETKSAPTSA